MMEIHLSDLVDATTVIASFEDAPPEQTASPTPPISMGCDGLMTDETGLVEQCARSEEITGDSFPITISNPEGDLRRLEIKWTTVCELTGRFTFSRTSTAYQIVVESSSTPTRGVMCDGISRVVTTLLFLKEPLDASLVTSRIVLSPDSTDAPSNQPTLVECVDPPMPPGMTPSPGTRPLILDETGLVATCAQTDVALDPPAPISVGTPFSDNELVVMWNNAVCTKFTVRDSSTGLELAAQSTSTDCPTGPGGPITIRFESALADSILVTLDGRPIDADVGPPTPSRSLRLATTIEKP
jgi:hypothetical protein